MIERMEGMPDGTLGFSFSGEVSRRDYDEVLVPALREAVEAGEVRCLCRMGPDFEGYEAGAVWEDMKTGASLGVGHLSAWKRMALVTDIDWVRHLAALFGWMTPGEMKVFADSELTQAKEWIGD